MGLTVKNFKRTKNQISIQSASNSLDFRLVKSIVEKVVPEHSAIQVSKRLLKQFGDLGSILRASSSEIISRGETSSIIAREFLLTNELLQAIIRNDISKRPVLDDYQSVLDYCRAMLSGAKTEQFHALFLDKSYHLISHDCLQTGTVDHVSVYPRELMRNALVHAASAIILVHNHPSNNCRPSFADRHMTQMLMNAGSYFGITIADHIIVSTSDNFSFRQQGLLQELQTLNMERNCATNGSVKTIPVRSNPCLA